MNFIIVIVLDGLIYQGSQIEETFSRYLQFKMGELRLCLHNQITGTEKMSGLTFRFPRLVTIRFPRLVNQSNVSKNHVNQSNV